MEAKKSIFSHRNPEEIRAWFNRRKAWYKEVEERAHAMYEEEQRLKQEAEEQHKYELKYA